ncbi:MAG TPA: twin-arginine translocase TatA/TatE family subunit [Patescibacteria group bacterium]|nr:twin-arginine translocase TatA/TatE family subunit [Patescibacteria group bacterium]
MGSDLLIVLIIVLIAVVIWRGPKTLPKIGQAFGRGVREARTEAAKLGDRPDGDTPT